MRVLVISTAIFPVSPENRYAGIETLVRLIAGEINRRGHQVSLAAPQGSRLPKGIEHINTGPCGDFIESEKKAYWGYSYRLRDFDAILEMSHTHWAMIENDLPGLAFIWHDPFIMKPLEPTYNICGLSDWQLNRFRMVYGYEGRLLDPHCSPITPESQSKPSNRFIFIGKMGPDKGCLEAIRLCKEAGQSLDIIGAPGPGDPPEYLEQVKAQCNTVAPVDGPVGQITYCGEVPDSTKNYLLTKARALLYPVNYKAPGGEAHSHKIVDALMFGCPCITYNQGAMSEVIEHEVTGFLASDEHEFKQYMLKVNALNRKRLRKIALSRWSVEATVDRLLETAEKVSKGERWGARPVGAAAPTGQTIIRPSAPSAVGYVKYEIKDYPRQIRLDTINRCNAKCIPCHLNFQKQIGGKMSMELITKILNEIRGCPRLEEIVPVNFGEFFLLNNWYEILKLIEGKLPQTGIALPTNGSLLDDDTVRKLASIRTVKWLNFSINAYFRETYEQFTGLGREVVDRITRAAELLRQLRPDITTCASMVFDTSFQTELERDLFIQFWQPLVSVVSINPAAYCNSPLKSPAIPVKTACRSIFDGLTILYDGTVVTNCCFDASGELVVGDANTLPLLYIWRGQKLRELCELHNQGRREEIELCKQCSFA